MTLYLDITNILEVDVFTGIPRVVSEVTTRLIRDGSSLCLLDYSPQERCYHILDNAWYHAYQQGKAVDKAASRTGKTIRPSDFPAGSIFFDLNSCWHTQPARSWLLPELKNRKVRIAALIYDLIPVTHPQFVQPETRLRFFCYLLAHMKYADQLFVNSQSVKTDLMELFDTLNMPKKPCEVVPLGADFMLRTDRAEEAVDEEARRIVASGRYLLTVGSVEPRKNHKTILEAFETQLAQTDLQLVFAGNTGWCVDDLLLRMEANEQFGKRLHHLEGMNDATIRFLYQHAFLVVFASHAEGYGLPTLEAIQAGVPVLASDLPIMREIGGDCCDYFPTEDAQALGALVLHYLKDPDAYEKKRAVVAQYHPHRWDDTAHAFAAALFAKTPDPLSHKPLRQAVFLSARPEPFLDTIPHLEAFLPFLEEVVVCCPGPMAAFLHEHYRGRLHLVTITDDQLLAGRPLPPDHTMRNFFLRCLTMEQDAVDDEFLMCDDDYRPLRTLTEETFFCEGRYQAYYFIDLRKWQYVVTKLFSYDHSMFRTLSYLQGRGLPTLQYSGHQPQIINKQWYRDMIAEDPDMIQLGLDEWSSYFNYIAARHPDHTEPRPYVTLGWPNIGGSWELGVRQEQYLFENFYDDNYRENRPFSGLSPVFTPDIAKENEQKIRLAQEIREKFDEAFAVRCAFFREYKREHGDLPTIAIHCYEETGLILSVPDCLRLKAGWHNCMRIGIARAVNSLANVRDLIVNVRLDWDNGNMLTRQEIRIEPGQANTELNFYLPNLTPQMPNLYATLTLRTAYTDNATDPQTIPITLV